MHADVYHPQNFLNRLCVMATSGDYSDYTCEQPRCTYNITGLCVKNHSPASACPFLSDEHDLEDEDLEDDVEDGNEDEKSNLLNAHDTDDLKVDSPSDDEDESAPVADSIYFASGEALLDSSIETITYAFPAKLILIIGGPKCGKTTLVSSVFESFQKGPLGDFIFAGSHTQVGFELISYLAREASGRADPDTERTKSQEFLYLHLSIRDKALAHKAKHLLFTDVSGERFKLARDNQDWMNELTILKKADHIFYVVDGEALSNVETRNTTKQDVIIFLRRAIKAHLLTKDNQLTILINKFDRVIKNSAEQAVESFFTAQLKQSFPDIIADVITTVARPKRDSLSHRTQHLDVFLDLCTRTTKNNKKNIVYYTSTTTNSREFSRFFSK